MSPNTDLYYDGGVIANELTDAEVEAAEAQQARDRRSELLNEALVCIVQARETIAEASTFTRLSAVDMAWVQQVSADQSLAMAARHLQLAGAKS